MSQTFKIHYAAFNREILKEFMLEEELNEIDKKYNKAKKERMTKYFSEHKKKKVK